MSLRILLLTQWFDPEPTPKGMVFARKLVELGYSVEVLTGYPNYPGGKIYPGYRMRLWQRETIDGVRINRVPLYPSHDQSTMRRLLNYASFGFTSLVFGASIGRRFDAIYAYHPPLSVGIAGSLVGALHGVPVLCDIQDMWPDTLKATGMMGNQRLLSKIDAVCNWVYRRVTKIVVLSPGFRRLLIERGVPEEKIEVIYNWADEGALQSSVGIIPSNFPGNESFRIVFAGNMGKAQGLDTVVEAARILQEKGSRVSFVFVGGGIEVGRLKKMVEDLHLRNITFLAAVPMNQVGTILQAADALLVHLREDPLFKITIPSKTQAYMAVGKPLLMAVDGDAGDLVTSSRGGLTAKSGDAQSLSIAAERLASLSTDELREMGERARGFYLENLALDVGVKKFANLFEELGRRARKR